MKIAIDKKSFRSFKVSIFLFVVLIGCILSVAHTVAAATVPFAQPHRADTVPENNEFSSIVPASEHGTSTRVSDSSFAIAMQSAALSGEKRFIVRYKNTNAARQGVRALRASERRNYTHIKTLDSIKSEVVTLPEGTDIAAAISDIQTDPQVESVEADILYTIQGESAELILAPASSVGTTTAAFIPNDPFYPNSWHHTVIDSPTAWDLADGTGVTIAIIDTGVACSILDLLGKCVEGFDIVNNSATSTDDDYGHGTWVASVAAAYANNDLHGAGEAFGANIMPIKINQPGQGIAFSSDIGNGIIGGADREARIVNVSFGNDSMPASVIRNAATYLQNKGGLVFQSAGNSNVSLTYADIPSIMTISATDQTDQKASFSNYGVAVDFSAPGVGIITAGREGSTWGVRGTSFSSPITAGVAALVLSRNPFLTLTELSGVLAVNADDLGVVNRDSVYGWGRVNAGRSVTNAFNPPSPDIGSPSVPQNLLGSTSTSSLGFANLSWDPSTDDSGFVNGYFVYRNEIHIATTSSLSYTDRPFTGLTNTYTVAAYDSFRNVSVQSNSVTVTVSDTWPPSTPMGLQAVGMSASSTASISLSWAPSVDNDIVVGYRIYRMNVQIGTTTTNSFLDTGLQYNHFYSYRVSAFDPSGNVSNQSAQVSTSTPIHDTLPPSTPINITGTASSSPPLVSLKWTSSTDNVNVIGYQVYRNNVQIATTTAPKYVDAAVFGGSPYTYKFRAFDAAGNLSAMSFQFFIVVPIPDSVPPSIPTNLQGTITASTSVTLAWTASTDNVGIMGYDIYRDDSLIASTTETAFVDMTVSVGHTYIYSVRAYDAALNVSESSVPLTVSVPDRTVPTAPSALSISSVPDIRRIDLTWLASSDNVGVVGYVVYKNGEAFATTTEPSHSDSAITFNILYEYRVLAFDLAGNVSPVSAPVSAAVLGDSTPPTTPSSFQASAPTSKYASLSWSRPTDNVGVIGYQMYRDGIPFATSTSRNYRDRTVVVLHTYEYSVSAYDAAENFSQQTLPITVTIPDTLPPTKPTGVKSSVTSVPVLTVNFSWASSTDNVGVVGYEISRDGIWIATTTETNYQDTGVTYSATYQYSVRAFDAVGNTSTARNLMIKVPATLTISNIQATLVSTSTTAVSENISWNTGTVKESGTLYYGTAPDALVSVVPASTLSLSQSKKLTGLKRNTTYYFKITAASAGQVAESDIASFTTQ